MSMNMWLMVGKNLGENRSSRSAFFKHGFLSAGSCHATTNQSETPLENGHPLAGTRIGFPSPDDYEQNRSCCGIKGCVCGWHVNSIAHLSWNGNNYLTIIGSGIDSDGN